MAEQQSTPNTSGFVSTGWICGQCGVWVSAPGLGHVCFGSNQTGYTITYPDPLQAAILEELRAIRKLLEKGAEPVTISMEIGPRKENFSSDV